MKIELFHRDGSHFAEVPNLDLATVLSARALSRTQERVHWQEIYDINGITSFGTTANEAFQAWKRATGRANRLIWLEDGGQVAEWILAFDEDVFAGHERKEVTEFSVRWIGPAYRVVDELFPETIPDAMDHGAPGPGERD